jgi:hypothetical protein
MVLQVLSVVVDQVVHLVHAVPVPAELLEVVELQLAISTNGTLTLLHHQLMMDTHKVMHQSAASLP